VSTTWKIGELAAASGVTVRTLHHYDELGLVRPGLRTGAGHRIYTPEDVGRLYRVLALRRLGLSLEAIAQALEEPAGLLDTVRAHREDVARALELHRRLLDELTRLLDHLDEQPPDTLIETIEVMQMIEHHYTPEQLEALAERRELLGEDGMVRAQAEWGELIAAMTAHRRDGTDPADPEVQALAARWQGLIEEFTGGDPGIRASLERVYREQGPARASQGMLDAELAAYVQRALAVRGT
jgi:MerR family transcriptional regulator, thiopeptide resistance regulator